MNPDDPLDLDGNLRTVHVFSSHYLTHRQCKMFILWGHGRLGKGNRTPLPYCAVFQIRLKFPENDAAYTGFSYAVEVLAAAIPI